ncbi:MAG: protease pro-enzyme activation domain-containing protein [Bryobacteraceae bacterium]
MFRQPNRFRSNRQFCLAFVILLAHQCFGQVRIGARARLADGIDERRMVRLTGNTRPEANAANDRGAVDGSVRFDHMLLQLQRSPEQQESLEQLLQELNDPQSPNFHKWLSSAEFGSRFGLAQEDLSKVTDWLEAQGFTVNGVAPNLVVDFSGTAEQVRRTFHTRIHKLSVAGKHHLANMTDPEIPAALAPAVAGIVSLNDFMPRPLHHWSAIAADAQYTTAAGTFPIVPSDLNTIYNFGPAFQAGFSGQGRTIAVLEDSNMYSTGDWLVFRKAFGLARPYPLGALVTTNPRPGPGGQACLDPGVNANSVESAIDAEWATAAAPSATIMVAACENTFTFGVFIALQNLLTNGDPLPDVVSISFGMSEAFLGAGQNAFINSLYQMAVAQGVSVVVAAGDSGAADNDRGGAPATSGIAVNGFASTPYDVAVGGTDFGDKYLGTTANYWNATNTPTFGSARSYIPEIPWNASCGSGLLAFSNGFSTSYGTGGYCNNGGPASVLAGGGGPSACAFGIAGAGGVVGNTCSGYPKPDWQSVVGNPADGVRDLPDVSMFASNNVWGHYYVACFSDTQFGGRSCLGSPNTWNGFGGTSLSAPVMAGIQALVNQKTGSRWGNPNPSYYGIARSEFGTSGNSACDSTGTASGNECTFHDITLGDNTVACTGSNNCFFGSSPAGIGVLSLSRTEFQPAFRSNAGWDFPTGLGTVNVWNLLTRWPNSSSPAVPTEQN